MPLLWRMFIWTRYKISFRIIATKSPEIDTWDPFHWYGLTLISTGKSNYIHYKVQDEITYLFPNFRGSTLTLLGLKVNHASKRTSALTVMTIFGSHIFISSPQHWVRGKRNIPGRQRPYRNCWYPVDPRNPDNNRHNAATANWAYLYPYWANLGILVV